MPCDYKKYPSNWKTEIRPAILERAEHRCEQCGVPNRTEISRDTVEGQDVWSLGICSHSDKVYCADTGAFVGFSYQCDGTHERYVKIVLTIAHLDHDTTNNDYSNLRALCQRCHLNYDKELHARNRAATIAAKKNGGQRLLF